MKKFLFTLAAMFMVSAASASCYVYMDDITVTADDEAAGYVEVPLMAHFDHYASALNIQVILPDGVVMDGDADPGAGLSYTWYNSRGRATTAQLTLNQNSAYQGNTQDTRFIIASQQETYAQVDGAWVTQGMWHFAPGDYELAVVYYAGMTADMKNVPISIWSDISSSGYGDHSNDCGGTATGCRGTYTAYINKQGETPEPTALTADITIGEADGLFVPITIENVNDPEATITVTVGGVEQEIVNGGITLPEWNTDYAIVVTVTAGGEGYEGEVSESATRNAGAQPKTDTPTIVVTENADGSYTVTVQGNGTLKLYNGGTEVEFPFTTATPNWDNDVVYNFTATAQEEGKAISDEATATVTVEKLVPTEKTATPTIVVTENADGSYTVTVQGNGELHLYANGTEVEFPFTTVAPGATAVTYNFTATAQEEHKLISDEATQSVTVPAAQVIYDETCLAPNSGYTITGYEEATITITNREPGATVYYEVYCNGVLVEQGSFTGDSYQITETGDGAYEVHCYAHLDGKNDSADGGVFFSITEGEEPPVTGIDELANGKTVAGVRYFNMAGQEMQEVNGMTIVVTTYTDGTTSAVKVMK